MYGVHHVRCCLCVDKVLFIDAKLRLAGDVVVLWRSVVDRFDGDDRAIIGLVARPDCTQQCWAFNLIAFDLNKWSKTEGVTSLRSQTEVSSWLSAHTELIFPIDCSWAVESQKGFNVAACLHQQNGAQSLVWAGSDTSWLTYSGHGDLETTVESLTIIYNSEPLPLSGQASPPAPALRPSNDDPCAHFRRVAALRRRTHPYYHAGSVTTGANVLSNR